MSQRGSHLPSEDDGETSEETQRETAPAAAKERPSSSPRASVPTLASLSTGNQQQQAAPLGPESNSLRMAESRIRSQLAGRQDLASRAPTIVQHPSLQLTQHPAALSLLQQYPATTLPAATALPGHLGFDQQLSTLRTTVAQQQQQQQLVAEALAPAAPRVLPMLSRAVPQQQPQLALSHTQLQLQQLRSQLLLQNIQLPRQPEQLQLHLSPAQYHLQPHLLSPPARAPSGFTPHSMTTDHFLRPQISPPASAAAVGLSSPSSAAASAQSPHYLQTIQQKSAAVSGHSTGISSSSISRQPSRKRPGATARRKRDNDDDDQAKLTDPTADDILFGRGQPTRDHTGNQRMRALIEEYGSCYQTSEDREGKTALSREMVARLKAAGSRFLKIQGTGWVEVSDNEARRKLSHAMRDHISRLARTGGKVRSPQSLETAQKRSQTGK